MSMEFTNPVPRPPPVVEGRPSRYRNCEGEKGCTHDLAGGVLIDELRQGDGPFPEVWVVPPIPPTGRDWLEQRVRETVPSVAQIQVPA